MTKKQQRPDLTGLSIGNTAALPTVPTGLIAQLDTAPAPEIVPIGDVSPHPDNPRSTLGDLTGLGATIKRDGLIQPIVVIPAQQWNSAHPDRSVTGKWLVIAGHRRLEASREASQTTIRISVRPDLANDLATLTAMFVENTHRENLTPMDEAAALGRLRDQYGLSQVKIAQATGISQGQVSKRLALLTLPANLQQLVNAGQLTSSLAQRFLQLPEAEQAETTEALTRFSLPAEEAIARAERRVSKEAAHQSVVDGLVAKGVRVISDPYTELGPNHHDHALVNPSLIESAIEHGSAIAYVSTFDDNRVDWYCASPGPAWPWLTDDEPIDEEPDSTSGSAYLDLPFEIDADALEPGAPTITDRAITEPEHTERDTETASGTNDLVAPLNETPTPPTPKPRLKPAPQLPPSTEDLRHDTIRKYLSGRIRPAHGNNLLLALTLVPSDDVEDPDMVCDLEGAGGTRTWTEHVTWVAQMVTSDDTAGRMRAALAVAFARAETMVADQTPWKLMTPGHRLYMEVLAEHIGYLRADHELSPR